MKLLSWNVQHGGGSRLDRIADAIIAHNADVIALSEFRARPGAILRATLTAAGWPHVETTDPAGSGNGLAVFSRTSHSAEPGDFRTEGECRALVGHRTAGAAF